MRAVAEAIDRTQEGSAYGYMAGGISGARRITAPPPPGCSPPGTVAASCLSAVAPRPRGPGDLERAFEPEVALGARDPRRSLRRICAVDRGVDDDMMMCRTRCCWVKWCSKYPFNDFHHK